MDMNCRTDRAVSPVVAVILMVAITVILSAAVGALVFNIGQSSTSGNAASLGVQTSHSDGFVTVQVMTGEADELKVLVNGNEAEALSNPSPGDELTVSASPDDDISVVSISDGDSSIVATDSSLAGSGSSTQSATDGLVSHYAFNDDSTPDTAVDYAGTNEGEIVNSSYVTGVSDSTALRFDGTGDDMVDVGTFNGMSDSELTVAMWVKCDDGETESALSYAVDSQDNEIVVYNLSAYKFHLGGPAVQTDVNFCTGEYTHLATTWRSSDGAVTVYKDGQPVATGSVSSGHSLTDSGYLVLGAEQDSVGGGFKDGQAYNGDLDDVRVYNRVLSDSEVEQVYNETK